MFSRYRWLDLRINLEHFNIKKIWREYDKGFIVMTFYYFVSFFASFKKIAFAKYVTVENLFFLFKIETITAFFISPIQINGSIKRERENPFFLLS